MVNAADNTANPAGRCVRQPTGYRAFLPAPLPPVPALDLTGDLRAKFLAADHTLGRLDRPR